MCGVLFVCVNTDFYMSSFLKGVGMVFFFFKILFVYF